MATRCNFDNTDVSNYTLEQCESRLLNCFGCKHFYYCEKVCELNDRIKELDEIGEQDESKRTN